MLGSSGAQLNEQGHGREAGHATMAGAHGVHARWPCQHSDEQVAGAGVGKVGRRFGLARVRIGPWAKNEVWSTPDALQLCLRVQGH